MEPNDLTVFESTELPLRAVSKGGFAELLPAREVSIYPSDEGMVTLAQSGVRSLGRAAGRRGLRALSELPKPDRRLTTVTAVDPDACVVRVVGFGRGLHLPNEVLTIRLAPSVLETFAARRSPKITGASAIGWATEQFLLPSLNPPLSRLIARVDFGAVSFGHAFSIIGSDSELDVVDLDGALEGRRLTPTRQHTTALTTALIECVVKFSTSLEDEIPRGFRLGVLLSEGDYLHRWARYNEVEYRRDEEVAQELGEAQFSEAVLESNGSWRFQLVGDLAGFLERIDKGMALSATADESPVGRRSAFTGDVERIVKSDRAVLLRPLTNEMAPPERGVLRYALAGSTKTYARRLDATRRLAIGAVPLPELAAILEMRSTAPRRVDRQLGWDGPGARAVFAGTEPTDAQKRAIELALNTPDLAVIQGPPGTGKTKVISAIAARVAEELGDAPASRQILITSHQHDAVDNAAARTVVFGLPTVKEGLGQTAGSWLLAWRRERLRKATELYRTLENGEVMQLRTWAAERRDAYLHAPTRPSTTADVLDEVLRRCNAFLPGQLTEDLDAVSAKVRRQGEGSKRHAPLVTAIRSIRTSAVPFADDGPDNARRVLARLRREPALSQCDHDVLDRAGAAIEATAELLGELALTKERLLDEYAVETVRLAAPARNDEVARVLCDVVDALEARLQSDGKGLALVLARFVHDLEADPIGVEHALASYAAVVAATCQASGSLAARPEAVRAGADFNTVIVDEAARANPLDLQIPMTLATRRVVLVGDQRQLPHIVDDDIARALSTNEAEAVELEESLFGRLYRFLQSERLNGRPDRVVTLNSQFRMHPALGAFVSQQFYEPHGETIESPLGAAQFAHQLPGYGDSYAAWRDVGPSAGDEERVGTSRARWAEAKWISTEVRRLMEASPHLTFGVISFYKEQVNLILEELEAVGVAQRDPDTGDVSIQSSNWRFTTDMNGETVERLRVGTVDAFQGKEFDVVLLSTVRTPGPNKQTPGAAFGHLVIANRLCVAMSRQRRLLVVVGDRSRLLNHKLAGEHIGPLVAFADLVDRQPADALV